VGVSNQYPSYAIFVAVFLAAAVVLVLMPFWIKLLRYRKIGQQIRADGPQRHLQKQGTPTMGGVVILVAVLATCAVLTSWSTPLLLALFATVLTALLGFVDDFESVAHKRSLGLTPRAKLVGQAVIVAAFTLLAVNLLGLSPVVTLPGGFSVDLGILAPSFTVGETVVSVPWLYVLFVFLLMGGFSNVVNLNDGLDGLCGGCSAVTLAVMGMVAFACGDRDLSVFAFACVGACVGFLWFNCYPASIFMGDTGSLALGTAFAAIAVLTKTEVVSLVIGGIFIIEGLSVIIQVASFKLTGRRVFLMAPLHHHFEKMGWAETKVVTRFWIIAAAFAAIGFALFFQLG
jgi:phospho-N-acetylmuramoyl-pentapeptide-transferase